LERPGKLKDLRKVAKEGKKRKSTPNLIDPAKVQGAGLVASSAGV